MILAIVFGLYLMVRGILVIGDGIDRMAYSTKGEEVVILGCIVTLCGAGLTVWAFL